MVDLLLLALERIRTHRVLVFWTLVGLTAATTLALSMMLYVDAVTSEILADQLDAEPYAFRVRYLGAWEGNIEQADVEAATASLQRDLVEPMALPVSQQMRFVSAGRWNLARDGQSAGSMVVGALDGLEAKGILVDGTWPQTGSTAEDTIPVVVNEQLVFDMGLQVGDTLTARSTTGQNLTLEVVGLWQAINADDESWVLPPRFFASAILMPMDTLLSIDASIEEVDWQVIFNGATVRASDIGPMMDTITDGQRALTKALPGVRWDVSPLGNMQDFSEEVDALTRQLVIVMMPVVALILYFVSMLAGMLVGRQQQEDILFSSRGMSRMALLRLHALIWLLIGAAAYGISLMLAPPVVQLVGRTTSFMQFSNEPANLTITFTQSALLAGLGATLLSASSGLMLAWRTTGQTITGFKRQQARQGKAWWQRLYLDLMMLVPAGYIYYTLQAKGGLTAGATEPFSDPLVFLAPTLFSLGATLVVLRLLPWLAGMAARFLSFTTSLANLMALRDLSRSAGRYRGTLLMMCFTLALIGFTASMASTLDQSLRDVIEYQIGADSVMVVVAEAETETGSDSSGNTTLTILGYNTLPASSLLALEGVETVARVGRFETTMVLPGQRLDGTVVGVDRWALASVAYFRDDYADQTLGALMNALALNRTGMLISTETATTYDLVVGQEVSLQITALGAVYSTTVPIVGMVDYFPTLDPADGFFMIGNLDPLFELVGSELPHDLWLGLAPAADKAAIENGARALGFPVLQWEDPEAEIYAAQMAPARRGVLGFLSIGFAAAIVLTLISNLIQMVSAFRAQALQVGTLRAMGMPGMSAMTYAITSQGVAVVGGVVGGTLIGLAATQLYLPLLDFSGGLPPYLIRVAWDQIAVVYGIFAGLLLGITLFTTILLSREQMTALVKLGDV